MSFKHQISLNELQRAFDLIDNINKLSLDDIEVFTEDGEILYINPIAIKEWKYTGMSNVYFLKDYFKEVMK